MISLLEEQLDALRNYNGLVFSITRMKLAIFNMWLAYPELREELDELDEIVDKLLEYVNG